MRNKEILKIMNKKFLVTGGCGFIGSHIVDRLVDMGEDVVVIDDLSASCNKEFYFNKAAEYYKIDITEHEKIKPLFEGVDIVFHLAARSRIQPTLKDPRDAASVNFIGTCNVLQAAREAGVDRVIYSSTSSYYGLKNNPPLLESMPRDCLNPYSVTKCAAEDLCKMYNNLFGLKCISFRYFNIYGDRQPVEGQYAPVVGLFLEQSKNGEDMTIVGDGLQTRDFTNVFDVVEANILASQTKNESCFGNIFNVGTGKSFSMLYIAKAIGTSYKFIPKRLGEAQDTMADISKINKMLGWKPKIKFDQWLDRELGKGAKNEK